MARLLLILAVSLVALPARAQSPGELRELALAFEHNDEGQVRHYASVFRGEGTLGRAFACIELAFAGASLRRLIDTPLDDTALADAVHALTTLDRETQTLSESATHCGDVEGLPRATSLPVELAYLRTELDLASELASEALRAQADETTAVLVEEARRLLGEVGRKLEGWPTDAWPFARATWEGLDPPPAVEREWRFRSPAPSIGSGVLVAASGITGFVGSLPSLATGEGIPRGIAGAWGLAFGSIAAAVAGAGWAKHSRALSIAGAVMVTLAGSGALLAIGMLDEPRGRWFGGGLLLGAGLGALWTIGSFAHLRHHRDADDAWRDFVQGLSVSASPRGASLGWNARF
ncbi:MAG: hypothetical protein H6722_27325 [Sandaracinus sp.]|nr:hypothetical protein [Sandaracinus sp.]MCB9618049.1 hypothetical protein [Sandaracinus sp.]MCB9624068.1 hypothetical protein [Sandaracinus sp.]